jgi:glycosyltransferase involved in cell wall biosynthesis
MANCLIVHPDLSKRGGAEGVCMNVLAALQDDHELELLTYAEPSFPGLNDFYDTAVDDVSVRVARLPHLVGRAARERLGVFRVALLNRELRRIADRYDIVVSTYNEFSVPTRSVQYVHHPNFDRSVLRGAPGRESDLMTFYDRVCRLVAGVENEQYEAAVLVANSRWTAEQVTPLFDARPEVIYPPVDVRGFEDVPWDDREPGFVTVGRIEPAKNQLRTIRIVDELRERGHDVHLHVVGPPSDRATDYVDEVVEAASERRYVHREGAVSRNRLVDLISNHRYGIHGNDHEHFGIAVAELVAGGTIPFVPAGGGQQEIVSDRDDLVYASAEEAVDRIDRVLSSPSLQREVRVERPDVAERFGRERFREQFRAVVEASLP